MAFELSTDIFNIDQLKETDLSLFDSFYLGNPVCNLYKGNLIIDRGAVLESARIIRGEGKKFYITTPVAPRGKDFDKIEEIFEIAKGAGASGIEFHNMGVLYKISRDLDGFPAHAGVFANLYTQVGASFLSEYGVTRVRPNVEVSLDEMGVIRDGSPVEVTVTLHGKVPLGIVSDCFLIEEGGGSGSCPEACLTPALLEAKDWMIWHVGKGIYSARDLCMIEHLDLVARMGFRVFRVEGGYESPEYRNRVGKIYREGIIKSLEKEFSPDLDLRESLRSESAHGMCNGYMFGRAGKVYLDRSREEINDSM